VFKACHIFILKYLMDSYQFTLVYWNPHQFKLIDLITQPPP